MSLLIDEVYRAHDKHGAFSLLNPGMDWNLKLAALMEEVGEVAHELTYDVTVDKGALIKELIQVANVAISWVESLRGEKT